MTAYAMLQRMFDVADPFGEETVVREVAYRAGLLWDCHVCDLIGNPGDAPCEVCGTQAPAPRVVTSAAGVL